ncbi:MAG TPA: hypothetical protein VFC45_08670 [Pseudolabrys sp.]|nr:hypothetical protein [Pseudolabrys sp.]
MSVVWFVVGAVVAVAGVGMVGYGFPINEFSFGNTLIVSGTTAIVGGLVVMAIGAAIAQLHRLTETLATRPPVRSSRPLEMFEPQTGTAAASSRIPFPPKTISEPKSETGEPLRPTDAPGHAANAADDHAAAAPMLRNPDMATVAAEEYDIKEYEEVSLSPQQSSPTTRPADLSEPVPPSISASASHASPEPYEAPWRSAPPPPRPPQTSYFDTMWPAETRPAGRPANDEPKFEPSPDLPPAPAPEAPKPEPPVAILKSGVVDGMGYTLYVDGSIEAELPDGILRFASINELRDHLAKNS